MKAFSLTVAPAARSDTEYDWSIPARGADQTDLGSFGRCQGRLLYTRGFRCRRRFVTQGDGLIPARAGWSLGAEPGGVPQGGYPRSCGATVTLMIVIQNDEGSSPRLRGSLFPDCHGVEPHDIWPLGQDFRVAVSGQDSLVSVSWNLTP